MRDVDRQDHQAGDHRLDRWHGRGHGHRAHGQATHRPDDRRGGRGGRARGDLRTAGVPQHRARSSAAACSRPGTAPASLDLRDATLAPEGATLRVRAIFAGAQIIVPADWKVVSRVGGMGGLTDMREDEGRRAWMPRSWSSKARCSPVGSPCSPSSTTTRPCGSARPGRSGRVGASAAGWASARAGSRTRPTPRARPATPRINVADDVTDAAKADQRTRHRPTPRRRSTEAAADAADAAESEMAPAT